MTKVRRIQRAGSTYVPFRQLVASIAICSMATACHRADFPDRRPLCKLGEPIKFVAADADQTEQYRVSGWSDPEPEFTWTDATRARIAFFDAPRNRNLLLKMTLIGATTANVPSQPVAVRVNGHKIADWQVREKSTYSAVIPGRVHRKSDKLDIVLLIPNAFSLKAAGMGDDPRLLGVGCFSVEIDDTG